MPNFLSYYYKRFFFRKKWRKLNIHNNTIPSEIFPIESVKVGSYTYGILNVHVYDPNNVSDKLLIGNFVSIADNVRFILCENHRTDTVTTFPLKSILNNTRCSDDATGKGSIQVGDEVWIGFGATILSGVTIGKGAIIAAGAIVCSDVPPYTIAGGIPAQIIKNRFQPEIIKRMMTLNLIDLEINKIKSNLDLFYTSLATNESMNTIESLYNKCKIQ